MGKVETEPCGLQRIVGSNLHQRAMGPLRHQPPVLVNDVQTTVFGNALALDVRTCGVHQPQGFHRCEMHGLNGDHDPPPACVLPWTPLRVQHDTLTSTLPFLTLALLSYVEATALVPFDDRLSRAILLDVTAV